MKKIFTIIGLLICFAGFSQQLEYPNTRQMFNKLNVHDAPIYDADYYVATWGDDSNTGTFNAPWKTLYYAFDQLSAGDTLYIRGGTYYNDPVDEPIAFVDNINGTENNYICVFNYPDEVPILDGSECTYTGENQLIYLYRSDYWHFRGLNFTKVQHGTSAQPYALCIKGTNANTAKGIIIENCSAYNNEGNGIYLTYTDSCFIRNCDAYNNYDPVNTTNGNGFNIAYTKVSSTNTVQKCRSWNNLWGEGFDFWECEGTIIVDSCWAWTNLGTSGDGCGFELGRTLSATPAATTRFIRNCISVNNNIGFNQAAADVLMELYNNTSYSNGYNYVFSGLNPDNPNIFKNNIDYDGYSSSGFNPSYIHNHNSWDASPAITVTDADFASIDTMELVKPRIVIRNIDGSEIYELPEINFMKLAQTSDLIEAGIDVGLEFYGNRPDIGAFESIKTIRNINEAYTATSGGLTTGIMYAGTQFATITSSNAAYICCLPEASAATVGTVITGMVGANGFELRVASSQATTVYLNNVTTNVEAAIPANTNFRVTQIDATHWILECTTNLGAVLTAIIPDAV